MRAPSTEELDDFIARRLVVLLGCPLEFAGDCPDGVTMCHELPKSKARCFRAWAAEQWQKEAAATILPKEDVLPLLKKLGEACLRHEWIEKQPWCHIKFDEVIAGFQLLKKWASYQEGNNRILMNECDKLTRKFKRLQAGEELKEERVYFPFSSYVRPCVKSLLGASR